MGKTTVGLLKPNDLLYGVELQNAVKTRIEVGLGNARKNGNNVKEAFLLSCMSSFDKLANFVYWDIPRSDGEIKTFPANFSAAIQYALLKNGEDISKNYGVANIDIWAGVIESILSSEKKRSIFLENFWRSPTIVCPRRALPLQYILPHFFNGTPIKGVDLGCGLNIALPQLNLKELMESNIDDRDTKPINLTGGVGVDKQPQDIEWAMASEDPGPNTSANLIRLTYALKYAGGKNSHFPFVQASVFEIDKYLVEDGFDFAFSSFLRHQLGAEQSTQAKFFNLVGKIVKEGGIYIDIGKELLDGSVHNTYNVYDVDVYRILQGKPIFIGTAFTLKGSLVDIEVNTSFFEAH